MISTSFTAYQYFRYCLLSFSSFVNSSILPFNYKAVYYVKFVNNMAIINKAIYGIPSSHIVCAFVNRTNCLTVSRDFSTGADVPVYKNPYYQPQSGLCM